MNVTLISVILPIALVVVLAAWGIVLFSLVAAARGGKADPRAWYRQVQYRKSTGKDDRFSMMLKKSIQQISFI